MAALSWAKINYSGFFQTNYNWNFYHNYLITSWMNANTITVTSTHKALLLRVKALLLHKYKINCIQFLSNHQFCARGQLQMSRCIVLYEIVKYQQDDTINKQCQHYMLNIFECRNHYNCMYNYLDFSLMTLYYILFRSNDTRIDPSSSFVAFWETCKEIGKER